MSSAGMVDDCRLKHRLADHVEPVDKTANVVSASEDNTAATTESKQTIFQLVRRFGSVSDALRVFGALAVAAGMGFFLLDGVQVGNDLHRFYTSLGFAGSLTAAGLAMSMLLREQRGSRVFIGLALLSVPVNFTVFGALIYSLVPLDSLANSYPQFALWQAPGATSLTLAAAAGFAVLLPVVWFGLSVLARPVRHWLSVALLLSSAVLLVPLRQEMWAGLLALSSVVGLCYLCLRKAPDELALKTTEGRFAIALLFVAPVIVVARSLFLYQVSGFLVLALCVSLYICVRQVMQGRAANSLASVLLTMGTALAISLVSLSLFDLLLNVLSFSWAIIACGVCTLLLAADLLHAASSNVTARRCASILAVLTIMALAVNTIFAFQSLIALVTVAILVVIALHSHYNKLVLTGTTALLGIALIVFTNADTLWDAIATTGWWGIAIAGAAAIFAGSMLDRAGTVVEVEGRAVSQSPQ